MQLYAVANDIKLHLGWTVGPIATQGEIGGPVLLLEGMDILLYTTIKLDLYSDYGRKKRHVSSIRLCGRGPTGVS